MREYPLVPSAGNLCTYEHTIYVFTWIKFPSMCKLNCMKRIISYKKHAHFSKRMQLKMPQSYGLVKYIEDVIHMNTYGINQK